MKNNNHWLFLLTIAAVATISIALGQVVTAKDAFAPPKDFLPAENGQSTVPDLTFASSGAVNQPPSAKSLEPNKESPQIAGSTIVWTGTAYDPEGNKILYQFWLNGPSTGNTWKLMTNWSERNVWNWTTNPIDGGNNIIDLRVRDSHHAGPWGSDSHLSAEYFITGTENAQSANARPSLLSLKSDRQSPQDKGVKVTWTATASDPEGDTILYQYWLKGPSTEEQWVPVTPSWTTNNVWGWSTSNAKAGIYSVEVRVRDGYHSGVESSDDSLRSVYVIKQTGIVE